MQYSRFGLIGHPIGHSLSPALFKAGYGGRYPYELIETADFEEAYRRFLEGYDGINVTAPFKELAFAKADIISDECRIIGATNLLVKTPEGVKAYNSDYLGVRLWLQEVLQVFPGGMQDSKRTSPTSWAPPPAARGAARFSLSCMPAGKSDGESNATSEMKQEELTVLIVGCGGAGKAAAAAAVTLGCRTILMNRKIEKAHDLAARLSSAGYETETRPVEELCRSFREADIIIYNIPKPIEQLDNLTYNDFIADRPKHLLEANYRDPSLDILIKQKCMGADLSQNIIYDSNEARSTVPGVHYTSGKTWLLNQALTGYEIFTGEKPDLSRMTAVL